MKPANAEFARFVGSLLPYALRPELSVALHRGLIAFHTGVLMEYVKKSHTKLGGGALDEASLAWFLQSAMEPLYICAGQEVKGHGPALVAEAIVSRIYSPTSTLSEHLHSSPRTFFFRHCRTLVHFRSTHCQLSSKQWSRARDMSPRHKHSGPSPASASLRRILATPLCQRVS